MFLRKIPKIYSNSNSDNAGVPVMNLKGIKGDVADGNIGWLYFSDKLLGINYEREYIRIYKATDTIDLNDYTRVPLERHRNRFYLGAALKISADLYFTARFIFDMGSTGTIDFTSSAAERLVLEGIVGNKVGYLTKVGGVVGPSAGYRFRSAGVTLGNLAVDSLVLSYRPDKAGSLSSEDHDGLLGNGILDYYDIVLGFPGNALNIRPNGNNRPVRDKSSLGFLFSDRSQTCKAWLVKGFN